MQAMIQQMTQKKQQRNKGQRAWGRLKNLPHKFLKKNLKKYLQLKKHCDIPVIAKTADAKNILSSSAYELFKKNLTASELTRMVRELKSGKPQKNEFTQAPVMIP